MTKTVETVCADLKGLAGTVGAFVWHRGTCIASSLPKSYDTARLSQIGGELLRTVQLADKAGYRDSRTAFHWKRASLFSWPIGDAGVLGVLVLPTAIRGMLELSAALAAEDLAPLLQQPPEPPRGLAVSRTQEVQQQLSSAPPVVADTTASNAQLEQLEELLIEEIGPTGRALLRRAKRQVAHSGIPESSWLRELRTAVLAGLTDPGAWATVATSPLWAPSPSGLATADDGPHKR
ncbi:hypothetical protein ACFL5O_05275 [Myxococcota bacterium]